MLEIWNSIVSDAQACTTCNLHKTRTNVVISDPPEWSGTKQLMIIGEAPGADEDEAGVPFVGKSGKLLRSELHRIGIRRRDCVIVNCIQCRPPENRDPMPMELSACKKFFSRKFEVLKPKLIVVVGKVAAKHVLKLDSIAITKQSGTHTNAVVNGISSPVFILCHPAFAMRGTANMEVFTSSMNKLAKWAGENGLVLKERTA